MALSVLGSPGPLLLQVHDMIIAFDGDTRLASGPLADVARAVKASADAGSPGHLLVFDAGTSQPIELDLRGTIDDVLARLPSPPAPSSTPEVSDPQEVGPAPNPSRSGPGRPRLGVVAREITLLPRHWQWLSEQPGGASVTIRRLVEEARGVSTDRDRRRRAQESAYRFLTAMLGDHAGYEEATRALFAGDATRFAECASAWPKDLREHAVQLANAAFAS